MRLLALGLPLVEICVVCAKHACFVWCCLKIATDYGAKSEAICLHLVHTQKQSDQVADRSGLVMLFHQFQTLHLG